MRGVALVLIVVGFAGFSHTAAAEVSPGLGVSAVGNLCPLTSVPSAALLSTSTCGHRCLAHQYTSPTPPGISDAAFSCADATAALNSTLNINAAYVCTQVEGLDGVCNYSVVITRSCYQSGTEFYVMGYAVFSCILITC
jgi:hypothetical protein